MKCIVGLGNPEKKYEGTRHNIGFFVLDQLASDWQSRPKFKAEVAEITLSGEKCLLIKPTTYYNLVGESVRAVMDFYKLTPSDIAIIHDDLALPLGTLRTRIGGSHAGNNGLKSIAQHIGQDDTTRIRIGIANELTERMDAADFVLGKLNTLDKETLHRLMPEIRTIFQQFANSTLTPTSIRTTTPQ